MKERSFYDAFMMQLILCVPSIQGIAHSLVFLVLGLVKKTRPKAVQCIQMYTCTCQ